MSFFHVDLNRLEDPKVALRKEARENNVFIVLAILFAALVFVVGRSAGDLGRKQRELTAMRADLKAQVEALERDSNFVSEEDVKSLSELERKRVLWTRKLAAFSELTGDKIVLTKVHYQRQKLILEGLAETAPGGNRFELVSAFIDRLKAAPDIGRDFLKVEFVSSKRLDFQGQELLSFEVACLPK